MRGESVDEAVAEPGWRRIRIGAAVFRAPKGLRSLRDDHRRPDTAARGKNPIATLARHRRHDGATWFGMTLIPDTPGATTRVGDEMEILEAVEATGGPPR